MSDPPVIVWFRQDLRLDDNPALVATVQQGAVLPVYILDDEQSGNWRHEYAGITEEHPASFRKYLMERFIRRVPALSAYHLIDGSRLEPLEECERLNRIISDHQIDVALVGIGENGHLAFNDPPADFETEDPYILVELDEACRKQQLGEGWFESLEEVPGRAITMSIKQIMKSGHIICSVPDKRKAEAVRDCLEKPVSPLRPASILQEHPSCSIFLDRDSASLLSPGTFQTSR
ncbi:MAG: deoxyribodipyrimidine photo-lyase [Bacteroidales bacterium]